ncbi:alcohol dehydrogenase catalytic domain-containing protein, partial [Rhizobium sp. SEMIA 4085]|uniref:alcohol dehydrogenase catalytic domain-containing protein n=1 Tax=Rhizobium sp. SEMIA 4085 TaxID=2137761 RepID=UPI001FEE0E75
METTATEMDALVLTETNSDFVRTSMVRPTPAAGEVLVRVKASSVNPLDLKIKSGQAPHARHPLPAILGIDVAGVGEAGGPGRKAFWAPDAGFGIAGGGGGLPGVLATFVAGGAGLWALKATNLPHPDAAGFSSSFLTPPVWLEGNRPH